MKRFAKIKGSKKSQYFFRITWIAFLCIVSALLARYALIGISDMLAIGKPADTVMIEIPENSSLDSIAEILKQNKIISQKEFFKLYARATKAAASFSSGIYEMDTSMDYQAIINHLKNQSNIKNVSEITFTEGMSVTDYANLLEKEHVCNKEDFLKCCNSRQFDDKYPFIKDISNAENRIYKLEGYLFPDTYKFYQGENPSDIIIKLLNNYQKKVMKKADIEGHKEKASIKELAENKGMDMDTLINIASLIQAEAANKEDMYKVSSVIQNRLATLHTGGQNSLGEFSLGILRIDSTVYYPYKNKASVPKSIAPTFHSTYDTYNIEGLPPGPICNPGMDAILAALDPQKTDYYYYCHSSSGEAFYARTNAEHSANLKKAGLT